jgi:hypothetical protein
MKEDFFTEVYKLYRKKDIKIYEEVKDGSFSATYWSETPWSWENEPSKIILEFDRMIDMLNYLFDMWEGEAYNIAMADSPYSNPDYIDNSTTYGDFEEGYFPYSILDSDNKTLVKEIGKYLIPGLDIEDNESEFLKKFYEKLKETNETQIDNIADEYNSLLNNSISKDIYETSDKEINGYFKELGFKVIRPFEKYSITIPELVKIMLEEDLVSVENLIDVLKYLIKKNPPSLSDYESSYEFGQDPFSDEDITSFNRDVEWNLSKVLDEIGENEDKFPDFDFLQKVKKLYKFNNWYKLPKNEQVEFKILQYDPFEQLIQINVKGKGETWMDHDEFFNFLYHPELF